MVTAITTFLQIFIYNFRIVLILRIIYLYSLLELVYQLYLISSRIIRNNYSIKLWWIIIFILLNGIASVYGTSLIARLMQLKLKLTVVTYPIIFIILINLMYFNIQYPHSMFLIVIILLLMNILLMSRRRYYNFYWIKTFPNYLHNLIFLFIKISIVLCKLIFS